jgi:Flp pilus assembly protein TadD
MLLLSTTLLASCSLDQQTKSWLQGGDRQAALDKMEAPEVSGINSTMEKQAIEAAQKGNYTRAGQFYRQLIDSPKASADDTFRYKLGLAEAARRAGDKSALPMYEELIKAQPDHIEVMEGYGLSLMQSGKPVDAGRVFADIMKENPKRWRTLNALGILFVNKNMIPEAMAYYTEALKHSPDNPAILNNVALSQAVDRNYARSFESFEQALRVSSTEVQRQQISLNMAMVYGISGDLETARTIASKYLQGPLLDNNLGLYAHLSKDDSLAKTYLDMALSGSTTYYERAWNNLDIIDQKKE